MTDEHIIIDGYNVIFRTPFLRELAREELERSRTELVRMVAEAFAGRRGRITVVFDGNREVVRGGRARSGPVRIEFSTPPETADRRIQSLVERARRVVQGRRRLAFRIVSSDREVAGRARLWGARAIGVQDFMAEVERRRRLLAEARAAGDEGAFRRQPPRPPARRPPGAASAPANKQSPPGRSGRPPAGPAGPDRPAATGRTPSRAGRRPIQPDELERKPELPGQSEVDEWERLFRDRRLRDQEDGDEDEDEP